MQHEDICLAHTHPDILECILKNMPKENKLQQMADFFKVFGDMTRLKMLLVLSHGELCVDDIARSDFV